MVTVKAKPARQPGSDCGQGGQEVRQVHLPGLLHGEDSHQAGHQGWPEGDLRQDGDGEGEARAHRREGVPRSGFEEERLRVHTCTLVRTRALTCQFTVEIYGIARWTQI